MIDARDDNMTDVDDIAEAEKRVWAGLAESCRKPDDETCTLIARRLMGLLTNADNVIAADGTEVTDVEESARSDSEFIVVVRSSSALLPTKCYRVTVTEDGPST